MTRILITGGTGMVGRALSRALLAKGYEVIILTRAGNRQPATGNLSYAQWDVANQTIDKAAIGKADHIIHLAGAGVAEKRWTRKRKQEIIDSRIQSGKLLLKSLTEIPNNVKSVIAASAIGWYGPDPVIPNPHPFTESASPARDFLGQTCQQWENSIEPVTGFGKRLVKLRIGIVLSKKGGALKEFIKPLRFGTAAILGNGKQAVSWIHIDDLVQLFIDAVENDQLGGVYNAVAPFPVTNKQLTLTLARHRNGRWFLPFYVPSFILKMVLGEMSIEVLKSATVSSEKIQQAGFCFQYPAIEKALQQLMKK